ncbi:MAG TPA: IclR family transcriptional regulator [Rhodobacterales bacterium]|nr:IclR family transcriptional regulator [Rhodobacterales bacterium]
MSAHDGGTVGKALGVLDLVAAQDGPIRFSDLQRLSPLPKATLYRLTQTLTAEGMLTQDGETGAYTLGMRLVRLAHTAWRQASLAPIARPHLEALADETGHAVHLGQLDYGHVLYLDKIGGTDGEAGMSGAGKIVPAYCTAQGKAMLAYLDPVQLDQVLALQSYQRFTPATLGSEAVLRQSLENVRQQGFALDLEEYQDGVICVAAPVLSAENRVLGAVSLTAQTSYADRAALENWVPQLRDSAEAIAAEMMQWTSPAG